MNKRQFSKVFNEHSEAIFRFACWRVRDKDQAEDIMSAVFTKAWEKRDSFDGKYVEAWLYTIARNMIIDGYRKYEPEKIEDENDLPFTEDATEQIDRGLANDRLDIALGSIDEVSQEIIRLRYIERFSIRDTAARTDQSEANVRVLQHRALKKLKAWYESNT
jgi:RNA polymerase sigma-70 factor, ECF subfamily